MCRRSVLASPSMEKANDKSRAAIWLSLGGMLWSLWGAFDLLGSPSYECGTIRDSSADVLLAIAGGTTAIGLFHLTKLVGSVAGAVSRVMAVGVALLSLGNLVEHCAFEEAWVLFVLGALGTFFGGVVLGAMLIFKWNEARYLGAIILLGSLAPGVLAQNGGFLVYGLALSAFALFWRLTFTPVVQDSSSLN